MDKLLETIVEAIQDKKGHNIVSLDMSQIEGAICSTFVICDAESTTQVGAIASGIENETEKKLKEKVWRVEGLENSVWVVLDYGDVMVHIFQTPLRSYYDIEKLWADAPATRYESED